jgi:hypothetical protein
MSKSSTATKPRLPLTEDPICKSIQNDILAMDGKLSLVDSCPVCLLLNINCPIGYHYITAEMMTTSLLGKRKDIPIDLTNSSSSNEDEDSLFDKKKPPSSTTSSS